MASLTEYPEESAFLTDGAESLEGVAGIDGGDGSIETSELPPPQGATMGTSRSGRRRTNLLDLNIVVTDLRQLNLDQVTPDAIAALYAYWLRQREHGEVKGYQPKAGGPTAYGVHGKVAIGVEHIVIGLIALRDPEVREAMRVQTMMLNADEPTGDLGDDKYPDHEEDEFGEP